jgi:hypothetical protein
MRFNTHPKRAIVRAFTLAMSMPGAITETRMRLYGTRMADIAEEASNYLRSFARVNGVSVLAIDWSVRSE